MRLIWPELPIIGTLSASRRSGFLLKEMEISSSVSLPASRAAPDRPERHLRDLASSPAVRRKLRVGASDQQYSTVLDLHVVTAEQIRVATTGLLVRNMSI